MSASNIQKVNNLAQEFMKHGIVSTSQEALAKAEAALHGTSSGNVSIEESETVRSIKRDISIMQKSIADLEKQVMFLTTKFSSMSAEILALKTRPVEQKKAEVQTTISGETAKMQQAQSSGEKATQTVKGQTFSEDDISIDKIFYFGKK